eukprot:2575684-Alexandrium_andersonii.AAC.1
MSASLVGSEMCIRDRVSSPRAPCRMARLSPCHGVGPLLPAGPLSHREAVSYTHLTLPTICSV